MPELPEIVAHAERLLAAYGGAELAEFDVLHLSALKSFDPPPDAAVGSVLTATANRGKYLKLCFGEGDGAITHVVHLMQGGRLRADDKQSARPRGGMARWVFTDGRALLLTEAGTEHKAGVWTLVGDVDGQEPLAHLGPDVDTVGRDSLAGLLASHRGRLHGFMRDQRQLAGVGRLLANEIIHHARLSPFANTASLDESEVTRLHDSMVAMIRRGLDHERGLDDLGRSADRPSSVHHRVGQPCLTCGDEVRSVEYKRYTVAYCASCQTGGKVLADNTTSKFLK